MENASGIIEQGDHTGVLLLDSPISVKLHNYLTSSTLLPPEYSTSVKG